MTPLDQLELHFYDLILKKALNISLKSIEIYTELSNEGREVIFLTSMPATLDSEGDFYSLKDKYCAKKLQLDHKNQQVHLARKESFSNMGPKGFALSLTNFYGAAKELREELSKNVPCGTLA